ncbi:sensor histidine kinase [Devosia ginsengisoli]|uniref:histidine kinase n=1 Tax=Devosia ginsengisoli TaxID=400770 RepID=A0A5B8LX60_9HYPH|nr:sensor histidine kinase [Devosia ginsengisoli]QDZ12254.1 HAMP domain-containing protein [Devosia ginsengisoli]
MAGATQHRVDRTAPALGRRPWPVVLYLVALMLVILIPALVVSLVLLNRNNDAQEQTIRALTTATVEAMAQAVDNEVGGMLTTLRVLSTSELLRNGRLADFRDGAVVSLEQMGANLIALDADLDVVLNTDEPFGSSTGKTSDPASAERALAAGVAVSNLFTGKVTGRALFNVLVALPDNPSGVALLALTQEANRLTSALQARQLPSGWHAALVDTRNVVIAATPEAGLETGTTLPVRQPVPDAAPDQWRRELFDGKTVVTAERRAPISGWRVVAWASTDIVGRPIDDSRFWLAAWGILIALFATGAALLISQRVAHSVRGLRREAQKLGRGEVAVPRAYPVAEIAEVSQALAEASAQRQTAENEVRFLMRELAHRSKNQMTVIAAMAKQTARGADNVEDYVQGFERRIHGLARSTDLLLAHGLAGVLLGELVESQIAPFSPPDASRVDVAGPTVRLNVQAAQIMGMAAHELSTNAVKYGAFAGDGGTLKVRWRIVDQRLDFNWRETVPHTVATSDRVGFGTTVLQSMVGRSLGAEVERHCHDDGMEWRFLIPLSAIDPSVAPATAEDEPSE